MSKIAFITVNAKSLQDSVNFVDAGFLPYNKSFGDKEEVGGANTAYSLDAVTNPIVFYNTYHRDEIYVRMLESFNVSWSYDNNYVHVLLSGIH